MKKILAIIFIILFIGCSINNIKEENNNVKTIKVISQTSFVGLPIGSNYEAMVNNMNIVFPFIEQVWIMGHPNKLFSQVEISDITVTKEIVDETTGVPILIEGFSNNGDTYKIEFNIKKNGHSNKAEFILYVNGKKEYGIMEVLQKTKKKLSLRSIIKYYPNTDYNVKIDVDFPEPWDIQYIGKQFEVRVEVFGKTFKETMWTGKSHSDLVDSLTMFLNNLNITPVEEHMAFAQTLDPYLIDGVAIWENLAIQIPDSTIIPANTEVLNTLGTILADYWGIWTTAAYYLTSKLLGG